MDSGTSPPFAICWPGLLQRNPLARLPPRVRRPFGCAQIIGRRGKGSVEYCPPAVAGERQGHGGYRAILRGPIWPQKNLRHFRPRPSWTAGQPLCTRRPSCYTGGSASQNALGSIRGAGKGKVAGRFDKRSQRRPVQPQGHSGGRPAPRTVDGSLLGRRGPYRGSEATEVTPRSGVGLDQLLVYP